MGWHCTHRSDVAAVSGSWEDLELELQLPDKQDPASAWAQGQPGPLSPCHPAGRDHTRKVPEPCRTLSPNPFGGPQGDALAWHGASPPNPGHDHREPQGPPQIPSKDVCPHQGPALPGDTTHMSLQTPLKAFHHGSDSSVEVTCWSMYF